MPARPSAPPFLRPLDHLWVAILAALARALHLLVAMREELFGGLFLDSGLYAESAKAIRDGLGAGDPPYLQSPLYPWFLSLFPSMDRVPVRNPAFDVRSVQVLLGVATCVLVARIAGRISGRWAGLAAGCVAAVYGPLIHGESMVLVGGPQAFLLTAALAAAVDAEAVGRRWGWPVCGLALGLAAALRPTVLVLIGGALIGLLARALRPRGPLAARWLPVLGLLVGATLPIAPFALHNAPAPGPPVLLSAGGGFNFWVGNRAGASGLFGPPEGYSLALDPVGVGLARRGSGDPELSAADASAWWTDRALADVREAPGQWLRLLGRKLVLFFHPIEIPQLGAGFGWHRERSWPLRVPIDPRWIFFPAVLALWPRETDRRSGGGALALVGGAFALYSLATILFFVAGRYRVPITPIAIALASIAVVEWLHSDSIRRLKLLSFFLVIGASSLPVYRAGGPFAIEPDATVEERQRGIALLEQGRVDEAIEIWQRALRERDDASTRLNLARARRQKGQPDQALLEYQRALASSPRNALALFDLGHLLYEDFDDVRQATECFERAVEVAPTFHEAVFNLAQMKIAAESFGEARDLLEQALTAAPIDAPWRDDAERAMVYCVDRLAAERKAREGSEPRREE